LDVGGAKHGRMRRIHAAPDPQLLRIHRTNSAKDLLDGSSVSTLSRLFV
jgi:hypothetical protein